MSIYSQGTISHSIGELWSTIYQVENGPYDSYLWLKQGKEGNAGILEYEWWDTLGHPHRGRVVDNTEPPGWWNNYTANALYDNDVRIDLKDGYDVLDLWYLQTSPAINLTFNGEWIKFNLGMEDGRWSEIAMKSVEEIRLDDNVNGGFFLDNYHNGLVARGNGHGNHIALGNGRDSLYGGNGNDVIQAGGGNDYLHGGWGQDSIKAGAGDDTIIADMYDSSIDVGSGRDLILFSNEAAPSKSSVEYSGAWEQFGTSQGITSAKTIANALIDAGLSATPLSPFWKTIKSLTIDGIFGAGAHAQVRDFLTKNITEADTLANITQNQTQIINFDFRNDLIFFKTNANAAGTITTLSNGDVEFKAGAGNIGKITQWSPDLNNYFSPGGLFYGVNKEDIVENIMNGGTYRITKTSGQLKVETYDRLPVHVQYNDPVYQALNGPEFSAFKDSLNEGESVITFGAFGESTYNMRGQYFIGTQFGEKIDATRHDQNQDKVISGEGGGDTIISSNGNDRLYGGAGDDEMTGGAGQDRYYGGSGFDTVDLGGGSQGVHVDLAAYHYNSHYGGTPSTSGNHHLRDSYGQYDIIDLADVEAVIGSDHNDYMVGDGGGIDTSHLFNKTFYGMGGDDDIAGSGGDNVLYGGEGWDTIKGLGGNDTIYDGAGNDHVWGGAGADRFVFGWDEPGGANSIMDISHEDEVWIRSLSGFTLGNNGAHQYIDYTTTDGKGGRVWYDFGVGLSQDRVENDFTVFDVYQV